MSTSTSQEDTTFPTPASTPPQSHSDFGMAGYKDVDISETMLKEEEMMQKKLAKEEMKHDEKMARERANLVKQGTGAVDKKFKALEYLLNQSKLFSNIMLSQMQSREDLPQADTEVPKRRGARSKKSDTSKSGSLSNYIKKEDVEAKAGKGGITAAMKEAAEDGVKQTDIGYQPPKSATQPKLISGGTMRKYQLEGLEWMKSLYENGLNGILADEMGLGKTLQTISLLAFLREMDTYGPFLIVAPLSTTTNWVNEFKRWAPKIPVILYHGSKPERAELRAKQLKSPGSYTFPVVVTSYDICMNDRPFLANYGWKFIIVDEGHRMKNYQCKLVRELQQYQSANRLLITGTPLQNNLSELWSLLNFLMPEIFDKLEAFESWFDFSELKQKDGYQAIFTEERKRTLVASLHAILKPFLLRRVKADVEKNLPKKREYVLFAPLEAEQRELYQAILENNSRSFLEDKMFEQLSVASESTSTRGARSVGSAAKRKFLDVDNLSTPNKSAKTSRDTTPGSIAGRSIRSTRRKDYSEKSDSKYFAELEASPSSTTDTESEDEEEKVYASTIALVKREIGSKKLQNPVMQLRLCCNSPHIFYNPYLQPDGSMADPDERLVTSSGKMRVLDALLPELFKHGHKVLIFSQFKLQLDILQDYAWLRGWPCSRIDGAVAQSERADQIEAFNSPPNAKDAVNLFLLSTRAGGQGINLTAADTVILFDSDWNPQQDLQAQDRVHRIGQTRNCIIYRLATRGTVEQGLLEKAEGKRRLEKLVIQKGSVKDLGGRKDRETLEELKSLLEQVDGEQWEVNECQVLSKSDLKILTDRSEEAYDRAEKGQDEGTAFKAIDNRVTGGLLEKLNS